MDIARRRRQVAWICFESYLSELERLQAVELLEREYQLDGAVNLIAYIAKVCMQFNISLQYHNKLFQRFTKFMSDDTELAVLDPLLILQQEIITPSISSLVIESIPEKVITNTQKSAQFVMFETLLLAVLDYIQDKTDFFAILFDLTISSKSKMQDLVIFISEWIHEPTDFDWAEQLDQHILTDFVHLVYTALCELVGPVDADEYFHKALAVCEQKPESRKFSATQFL